MTNLDQILSFVNEILCEKKHLSCYLFGSYAKGKENENSDVDILIIVDKKQYDYKQITKIKYELEINLKK